MRLKVPLRSQNYAMASHVRVAFEGSRFMMAAPNVLKGSLGGDIMCNSY